MTINSIKLLIPNKKNPSDKSNLDTIERWGNSQVVNQIVAGTGVTISQEPGITPLGSGVQGTGVVTINASGSGYASLTGPGETVTPGALTQAGSFTVNAGTTGTITLSGGTFGPGGSGGTILIETTYGGLITVEGGDVAVTAHDNLSLTGANVFIVATLLSFFSGSGNTIQTITGSRSGNAALASLLTALASYGLIIDSTTA